jgi:hypothetical protein
MADVQKPFERRLIRCINLELYPQVSDFAPANVGLQNHRMIATMTPIIRAKVIVFSSSWGVT